MTRICNQEWCDEPVKPHSKMCQDTDCIKRRDNVRNKINRERAKLRKELLKRNGAF